MPSSPEQFNFSKEEEQKRFEQLPEEEQKMHIEKSHEEALIFEKERQERIFVEKSLIHAREQYQTRWSDTHFDSYSFKGSKKFENSDYVATIIDRTYEDYGAGDSDYNFLIVTDKEGNVIADKIGYDKYYNSEAIHKKFNFHDQAKEFSEIISSTMRRDKSGEEKIILKVRCKDKKEREFSIPLAKPKKKK